MKIMLIMTIMPPLISQATNWPKKVYLLLLNYYLLELVSFYYYLCVRYGICFRYLTLYYLLIANIIYNDDDFISTRDARFLLFQLLGRLHPLTKYAPRSARRAISL